MRRGARPRAIAIAAAASIALSGCTSLLVATPPPLDTFSLTAPAVDVRARQSGVQLLVAEPTALKDLDSQNIVVRTAPAEVQYLEGAQWSDRLPSLVQARMIQTFETTKRFGGVGRPGQGLAIDYQILVDIRDLSIAESGGSRAARAEITVKILDDRNGTVRATRSFSASAPVGNGENRAYAAALDRAFGSVAGEAVAWVSSSI